MILKAKTTIIKSRIEFKTNYDKNAWRMLVILAWKTLNDANIFVCLLNYAYRCTISTYQNGTLQVGRIACNIGEVWNPVCCQGNKTVEFVLWSTFKTILYCKESNISDIIGCNIFLHHIWSKFGWVYDVIDWLIYIFQKLEYLWNENRYLKIVKSIFLLIQTTFFVSKWLR